MKNLTLLLTFFLITSLSCFANDNLVTIEISNNYTLQNTSYSRSMSSMSYKPASNKYSQARKNLKGAILGTFCVLAVDGIILGLNSASTKGSYDQNGIDPYKNTSGILNPNPYLISTGIGVIGVWTWYFTLGNK